jgi:glycosyltransferase involved in cell wall biosynthesis
MSHDMQRKVSMVMPCYNKEDFIGEMFDSILVQEWDSIELILVNDGCTDSTGGIISEYESQFINRGFNVIIIDQENAGVCAAVKAGLERVTGDYLCVIDADDELDPKYVSVMAGLLEENPDYDYIVCGSLAYKGSGNRKSFYYLDYTLPEADCKNMTELYLLSKIARATWSCMSRFEYVRKCKIIENYDISTRGSHEPSFMIPLTAYGGRVLPVRQPLYRYNISLPVAHSRPNSYEKQYTHWQSYAELCKRTIHILPKKIADEEMKNRFFTATKLSCINFCFNSLKSHGVEKVTPQVLDDFVVFLNQSGLLRAVIDKEIIKDREWQFLRWANQTFWREPHPPGLQAKGRRIGYGAMGKAATELLPLLTKYARMNDLELWDENGDGVIIKKPDFKSLSEDDILLVLPYKKNVVDGLKGFFAKTPFKVFYNAGIWDSFDDEIYNGWFVQENIT